MKRKTFIKTAALGSLAVCLGCLAACKKEPDSPVTSNPLPSGGLEIDLSKPENSALTSVGGSLVRQGVIVAQTAQDNFVALSAGCTHEGTQIIYMHAAQLFRCPNHGSEFTLDGMVTRGPAGSALTKYTVTKNGSILKIAN